LSTRPSKPAQLGKYTIIKELGHGGFATVFHALDTTLEREVALKVLHRQLLTDPGLVERFLGEVVSCPRHTKQAAMPAIDGLAADG
jgi:serine/threonine-protein kinase